MFGAKDFAGGASNEFGFTRGGNGRDGKFNVPGNLRRLKIFLRIERVIPGNFFSGISGHAAHDGEQGAAGHTDAVVDRFAFANGGEEFVVLDLVHVGPRAGIGPIFFAFGEGHSRKTEDACGAFGAENGVGVVVGAVVLLAAKDEAVCAVGILVNDFE